MKRRGQTSKPLIKRYGAAKGEPLTPVIFRVWPKSEGGGVIALFPTIEHSYGLVESYEHMGGHGGASLSIIYRTRPAKPEEYAGLKRELESAPYEFRLRVMKRVSRRLRG